MQSKTTPEIQKIRESLGIDSWGADLYRLKKRLGQDAEWQKYTDSFIDGISIELENLRSLNHYLDLRVERLEATLPVESSEAVFEN